LALSDGVPDADGLAFISPLELEQDVAMAISSSSGTDLQSSGSEFVVRNDRHNDTRAERKVDRHDDTRAERKVDRHDMSKPDFKPDRHDKSKPDFKADRHDNTRPERKVDRHERLRDVDVMEYLNEEYNPTEVPSEGMLAHLDRNPRIAELAFWERSGLWTSRPVDYLVGHLVNKPKHEQDLESDSFTHLRYFQETEKFFEDILIDDRDKDRIINDCKKKYDLGS
jgi:hypothetical protein